MIEKITDGIGERPKNEAGTHENILPMNSQKGAGYRTQNREGFIYFVKAKRSGLIKLGFAQDVMNRVKTMQIGCPFELELIGSFPGTFETEKWLHHHFAHRHVRGEWFDGNHGSEVRELALCAKTMGKEFRIESTDEIMICLTPLGA